MTAEFSLAEDFERLWLNSVGMLRALWPLSICIMTVPLMLLSHLLD